jgi:cytochrome c-type biogenesis protein CcmH
VGAGALYLTLGSPAILTEPLAARLNVPAEQRSIEDMVAQVEAHLERNPDDARGWEVLAPIYLQSGRYEDSVKAWRNVLRLQGSNAEREANLGEALIAVANGIVTAEARAAFERAVAIDASTVRGRFYLGLAAEQDGRREEAAKIWRTLIAEAPADAHWVGFVREALARAEGKPETPGPAAEDLEAAAKLAPDQQTAMIRGMVDRLAERLKADGSDLDGWVRLLRSYKVLGETDKALAAAAEARRALAGEPDKLRRLDDAMKAFGFEG